MDFSSVAEQSSDLMYIFQEKIRKMDTSKFGKNKETAAEFRSKGNAVFAKKQYASSLELYTEAAMFAPFNVDKNENLELSLALANRSASLYHMRKYKECLEDVELSLKYGYPAKSRPKLILRKATCEQELAKVIGHDSDKNKDGAPLAAKETADKVYQIHRTEKAGKGLLAAVDIKKGQLILTEKPFVSILDTKHFKSHCYHCLKKLSLIPLPCRQCSQVRFCGHKCSAEAWQGYHWSECLYIDIFSIREDFHFPPRVAHRALVINGVGRSLQYEASENDQLADNVDQYEAFDDLVQHPECDANDYDGTASLVSAFIVESLSETEIISTAALSGLRRRIIKHIRQTNVNGITVTDKTIDHSSKEEPVLSEQDIGIGIYLTARLLNHSCEPNVVIGHFDGDVVVIYAAKDIKKGEELFHCYGANRKWQICSERAKLLKESYHFDCACVACANKVQPLNKAFKCTTCSGPVIADGKLTCVQCNATDHLDVQKILDTTIGALKTFKIGKDYFAKGDQDKNQFLLAERAFLEALDTMGAMLHWTHKEVVMVIDRLRSCCMKLTKFSEAVKYSEQLLDSVKIEYDEIDYHVFNALYKLVNCQKSLYLNLRSKTPQDKNAINVVKTKLMANIDTLLDMKGIILAPRTDESISYGQRLLVIRKLL
ncbi:SET and MYND domain-containing protein 4 [Halotydeus destructor]|nr:SET and MYND domain-containing protein 4 [Halotydeus destructor]